MNAPHPILHRPFVLRIWHGFESLPRRAQLRAALETLRRTHAVDFRFATAPELGDDENDVSHAHCVALDASVPPAALADAVRALANDPMRASLMGLRARRLREDPARPSIPEHRLLVHE